MVVCNISTSHEFVIYKLFYIEGTKIHELTIQLNIVSCTAEN